jgi:hypothetical protein
MGALGGGGRGRIGRSGAVRMGTARSTRRLGRGTLGRREAALGRRAWGMGRRDSGAARARRWRVGGAARARSAQTC